MPEQIEWEWLEYKLHFNGLLDRYFALLARDAKRHRREQQSEDPPSSRPPSPGRDRHYEKARLTSRVLAMRAGRSYPPQSAQPIEDQHLLGLDSSAPPPEMSGSPSQPNGSPHPHPPPEDLT